jgi:hypothetical protein
VGYLEAMLAGIASHGRTAGIESAAFRAVVAGNQIAVKAVPVVAEFSENHATFAFKSFDDEEGIVIGKLSVAENFDLENERIRLPALKAATYELVRNIGLGKFDTVGKDAATGVDINHEKEAIKCDVLMAWVGEPMPEPNACYVAVRPHDREIYEAAKKGDIVGFSWSGPYKLVDAVVE